MVQINPWSKLSPEQPRHAAPAAISYGCRVDGARHVSLPPNKSGERRPIFLESPNLDPRCRLSESAITATGAEAEFAYSFPPQKSRSRFWGRCWTRTHHCSIRVTNTEILLENTATNSHLHFIATSAFTHLKRADVWQEPVAENPPD